MASTLNLFALDRDVPASRQLQIVVENNSDIGKNENRLLVTDNKSALHLEELKGLIGTSNTILQAIADKPDNGGGSFQLSTVPYIQPTRNMFINDSDNLITNGNSIVAIVKDFDKVSIYYKDTNPTASHYVRVIGILSTDHNYMDIDGVGNSYSDYVPSTGNIEVDLYRFFPTPDNVSGGNTHNVIDLSIIGVSHIYLKIDTEIDGPSAYISAQHTTFSMDGISGETTLGSTVTQPTDNTEVVTELQKLNLSYNFTTNFIGKSYNLFVQNNITFTETINPYTITNPLDGYNIGENLIDTYNIANRETYYPLVSLWNNTTPTTIISADYKLLKINKIVLNVDRSIIIDKLEELSMGLGETVLSDDFALISRQIEHINIRLHIGNIDNTGTNDDTTDIILHSTTGNDTSDSIIKYSRDNKLINTTNTTNFTHISISGTQSSKEIVFNDTPFFLRAGVGLFIDGNSFFLPSAVNINVYFSEVSIADVNNIIQIL